MIIMPNHAHGQSFVIISFRVVYSCLLCWTVYGEVHCKDMTGMPSTVERASLMGFTQENVDRNIAAASRRTAVAGHPIDELFLQHPCLPAETCEQLVEVAANLMVPGHGCSIDKLPEYQVDLLQKSRHEERSAPKYMAYTKQLFDLTWPHIRDNMIPTIATVYKVDPMKLRFSEAFIRKYEEVCHKTPVYSFVTEDGVGLLCGVLLRPCIGSASHRTRSQRCLRCFYNCGVKPPQ
jgi:hypothetical protein